MNSSPRVITHDYYRTIVATSACGAECSFCNFRSDDAKLLTRHAFLRQCVKLKSDDVGELVVVSGEKLNELPAIQQGLSVRGFTSFEEYILYLCNIALQNKILPSLNIGVVSPVFIEKLRGRFASYSLSLETADRKVAERLGLGKSVEQRLESLMKAGELNIPTNTSILVGAGESPRSRKRTIEALAAVHQKYDNIQVLTLQNYVQTSGSWIPSFQLGIDDWAELLEFIGENLPNVPIQIPCSTQPLWLELVLLGANDVGLYTHEQTIGLKTRPIQLSSYESTLEKYGMYFVQRLQILPKYLNDRWCSPEILEVALEILQQRNEKTTNSNQLALFT